MSNNNLHNSELDDLKSLWKNQPKEKDYDSSEIFGMIKKNSINSVQWLFIISIAEMAFGLILSLWTYIYGSGFGDETESYISAENLNKLENFSYFGLLFSLVLIGIIYYYYKKIKSDMSVKQLISNIIIFRKTVIGYLIIGITLVLVFILPIYYSIGQENILNNAIEKGLPEDRLNQMANIGGWIMAGITLIIVVIFTLLYYFVVYGYFLRKLRKNKKELEELNV